MLRSLTPLTLLSSLLLASGQGALGHGLSDHAKRSIEQTMHISSKRALDGFYVIDQQAGSEWGCTEEKIAALEGAVRDTQALAFMASTVLAEKDSEFSDAYIFWFGEDNTKAATKNSIKTLNYDPVQDFLKAPGTRNRVDDMRIDNLSPTGLTYMCAAADDSMCAGGMAAAAHQHGAGGLSGHSIVLCDRFFGANSQQDMLRTWKDTRRLSASSGFWLLHEVQHLGAIVSDGRRCVDVPDPSETDGSGCYDANCCSRLKGADKIRNAQNMAFFALEVMADPQSGAAPGQSCTIMKRDTGSVLLGGPEDLMARAGYSLDAKYEAMLRRQAKASSTWITTHRNGTSSRVPTAHSSKLPVLSSKRPSGSASASRSKPPVSPASSGPQSSNPARPSSSGPRFSNPVRPSSSAPQPSRPAPPPSSGPRSSSHGPIFTTRPPIPASSFSGASFSYSYSTAPPTTEEGGVPIIPIVPIPIPIAPVAPVPPIVPPVGGGGGGNGGDNGNNGENSKPAESNPPKTSEPSSPPTSLPPTSSSKPSPTSSTPVTRCSSRPPLSVPTGGDASPDRDGFPQAVYDGLAAEARSTSRASSSSSTSSPLMVITDVPEPESTVEVVPTATPTVAPVNPVACYNFDINAYGYCCPGPGNPCEKDIGKCYFNGEGVSGGASGIVPDGARCPPPPGAEYCRGPCEE
ncbi:hypothetical protein CMEL01_15411 [Colletotrichum melonis]|uniref:Lysine-specific metallo-endopeptidase domain-containing protein n=1 Tax=Colletotrichum melonis TaxID=1209925 RepID=A0AAI9UJA2_9PEZI|nr:hypothetical protein CMEL01_15411 [Colletotrichum melonis]